MSAETAMRIISGVSPKDIQTVLVPTVPIFDWRQLRRWGISKDRLPKNSVLHQDGADILGRIQVVDHRLHLIMRDPDATYRGAVAAAGQAQAD